MAAIPDRERRWYFSREVLMNSPSRRCQIEPEKELSYRQQAANLIQDMGQRLQVNQLCINTAIVYMHRFYVFHSFQKFPRNSIAAAALFLAAKVEEQPHKLEYVIKVHHACLHRGAPVLDTNSDAYLQQAQELVINESILLQTLGFEVAVDHPHTHVVKCTQMIRASKDLAQTSYFMATNSLHLTTFCLQYKPTVVACVCIYLVAKWSQWEIMKSSDGKDWWEYVDPTVTKELLDELTNEFLRIFEACPSRLRRRISNERITSRRPRPKEGTTEPQSSSSTKPGPPTSASVSSIDSGLPGSSNSESSINTQESASSGQGESLSDLSHTDGEKLGLHEINMGLPMMEASMFSLDTEYMSGYNSSVESKQGLPSSQSDPERGRAGDQQGHPVKKSLKEYREQKERERLKAAQQSSRNSAPPRPSHTAPRPGTQANPHTHSLKGNVNSPHTDQRHREGYHSQVSQKYRPEDRHLPSDHRRAEKPSGPRPEQLGNHPSAKSSGRQTDIRPGRDQRPHSQHRPYDPAGHPTHGASATDSKYSKSSDQYHKHNRDAVQNSLDRKQSFGPNVQGKEYRKNGLESRDQGANSRPPETMSRLPSVTAPSKVHAPGSQRPHHTESTKTHSSDKVLTSDPHGKAHPETLRPTKSETHRSQRPENQETLKPEKHRTPTAEMLRVQKAQSLKPQRSETPKVPPTEKQPTRPAVPPLVPLVNATKEQRQVGLPTVSTQKAEPPQPIDHELPEPQRPERVLVQQLETVKVDKTVPPLLSRHDVSKLQKSEDMGLRRPEVLKVSKSDTSRTGLPNTQSPTVSKPKGPEVPKLHKSEVSRSQKAEMPRLPRTGTENAHKVEAQKHPKSDTSRGEDSGIPQTQKPSASRQLKPVKVELQLPETQVPHATGVEEPCAVKTHKAASSQPSRPETPKKHRTKPESGQTQRPVTPKSQTLPAAVPTKLEKSPLGKQHALLSPKVVDPSSQKRELPVVQNEPRMKVETPDVTASVKPAVRKKPQTPPASKSEAPVTDKLNTPSSEKLVIAKPKQPEIPSSDIPEKIKPQKPETVTPHKTNTQPKPSTPKSQRSMTPKSQQLGASQVSKPPKVTSVEVSKVTNTDTGGSSEKKVIWEPVKPLEVLKPGGPDQAADNESVDADIEKLITAHMAELSDKSSLDPLQFLDTKPTLPQSNTTEVRQRKRERDESSLPKSYRNKESHHRKKRSEDHRSRGSPHKHRRLPDHKKEPSLDADGPQGTAEHRGNAAEAAEDSHPHTSILTTTSGIKLKIKGLSNSMNSGSTGGNLKQEASPEPSQQTGSPALRLKLNLSKMQASQPNSDHHPQSEGERSERSSSHHPGHHRHHHHKHHKHHHKSRSQHRSGGSGESHRRKRSHSRSDSMSSGGRDGSPAITSPPKKRAHSREGHSQPKSLLPGDQSLLSLPMPPMDPAEARDSGYMHYNNSPSAASTGQFYNMSEFSYHAPLTTVTALPSSDVYGFYPDNRSSEDLPPPPPPPRQEQPPPPPPPPV